MAKLAIAHQAKTAAERWQAIEKMNATPGDSIDTSGLAFLVQALSSRHPFVRWQAGLALVHQPEGQQKLIAVLKSSNSPESELSRSAAADALGQTRVPNAYTHLLEALQDNSPLLRQSAAEALANQDNVTKPDVVPHLITALTDPDPWVRRAVAYALGHLGNKEAIPKLVLALQDKTVIVRRSAAYALGALRAETAVPNLITSLSDTDPLMRRNAAWALGRIGQRTALPDLSRLVKDTALNGTIAAAAGKAIEMITKPRWLQILLGVKGRMGR